MLQRWFCCCLLSGDDRLLGHHELRPLFHSCCFEWRQLPNIFSRRERNAINRLLIGHTHLAHSYLLNKDPAPTCEHCKCVLTIGHILCTCTRYECNRKQYFRSSQLSHILMHSPKRISLNCLTDVSTKLSLFKVCYSLIVLKVLLKPNQSQLIKDNAEPFIPSQINSLHHFM